MKPKTRVIMHSIIAGLLLFFAYLVVVGFVESFGHAIRTFLSLSYLMIPLIAGFGLQVGLYSYSRHYSRMMRSSASVAASGGISAGSMIACCLRHVTDVLPIIGFTAVASMLTAYQQFFISIGLLSNVVGILTILGVIQKHHLYDSSGSLARIMTVDLRKIRNYALILSLIVVAGSASVLLVRQSYVATQNTTLALTNTSLLQSTMVLQSSSQPTTSQSSTTRIEKTFSLEAKTLEEKGLTISVTPLAFSFNQEVKFKIAFDTHAGSLDFDVVQVTSLEDNLGNTYKPTAWEGSPPGGHHREGTVTFSPLSARPESIRLIIKDVYGVDSWIFAWKL